MDNDPPIEFDGDGGFALYTSPSRVRWPMWRSLALVPMAAGFVWLLADLSVGTGENTAVLFALAALLCVYSAFFGWNRFRRYAALRKAPGPAVRVGRDGVWDRDLDRWIPWDQIGAVGVRKAQRYHSGGRSPFRPMGSIHLSPADGDRDVELPSTSTEVQRVPLRYLLHVLRQMRPDKCGAQPGYDPWDDEAEFRAPERVAAMIREAFGNGAEAFVRARHVKAAKHWFGARRAEAWGRVAAALAEGG